MFGSAYHNTYAMGQPRDSSEPPPRAVDGGRDSAPDPARGTKPKGARDKVAEIGGPDGPEPTRYGDWERKGRCIDF